MYALWTYFLLVPSRYCGLVGRAVPLKSACRLSLTKVEEKVAAILDSQRRRLGKNKFRETFDSEKLSLVLTWERVPLDLEI